MAYDDLAPAIRIFVEDTELTTDVTKYVTHCEVDLSMGIADQIKLTVVNPLTDKFGRGYTGEYLFLDGKTFQPGNEVEVWMGYGAATAFVGRGVIQKQLPTFPDADEIPTLTIIALDASVRMMEGEDAAEAAVWDDVSHSDIVTEMANKYGFLANIETITNTEVKTVKKRGMSDYRFIQGLANLHGFTFKVAWDTGTEAWHLYFRSKPVESQEKAYTFTYNNGQDSTLLSFDPQFGLRDTPSAVKVLYFDRATRTWEQVLVEEVKEGEKPKPNAKDVAEKMTEAVTSSTAFRIAAEGVSVEVVPERGFKSPEEAQLFAERWLRARKDHFITGRGKTIGLEKLRAGEVHALAGIGIQLGGDWEFSTVTHIFDSNSGYRCEFFAHKVMS
jgi:phage protein D